MLQHKYGVLIDFNFKAMEYGYINEFGYLTSRSFTEDEVSRLDPIWKPVDVIDQSLIISDDTDYIIQLEPYDAGNHIAFRYNKVFDSQKVKQQICDLKQELLDGDYQIIKCYEALLMSQELPYDLNGIVAERQNKRDKINKLENILINAQRH